ncbi:MAG: 3'-5' exoribonuclease [Clostridia bacterium]|nr:3'-5' exoribonuclease [Clostridia bacterium]
MENLKNIISKKFGETYNFLKPFEVVYNTQKSVCTLTFLYPETISTFHDEQKKNIAEHIREELNLFAKTEVKFKKSYLDEINLKEKILHFFETYHKAVNSVMDKNKISIKKDALDVHITLSIAEKVLKNLNEDTLKRELTKYLSDNFCGNFYCEFQPGINYDEAKLAESDKEEFKNILRTMKPTQRYEVFAPVKLVGKDIPPRPEFLSKIKDEKMGVILAGKVQNLEKKSYKRIRNGTEVEKYYFKFDLYEENRFLRMLHFCARSHVEKMDKLANGDEVLVIADVKKDNKYLTGFIKSISLCQIDEEVRRQYREEIRTYTTIFPEPYNTMSQANIFDVKPEFKDIVKGKNFVVYDVETTGLDADTCEIIEIGAVKVENGEITQKFQTLVKPKQRISSLITDITGITNDMVDNAPPIESVIKDFYLFSKNTVLSGYNVGFDMKFIQKAGQNVSLKFDNEVLDVLPIAKEKLNCKNYKLGTVVKHLKLTLDNAHRAFFDALATAEVLLELTKTTFISENQG